MIKLSTTSDKDLITPTLIAFNCLKLNNILIQSVLIRRKVPLASDTRIKHQTVR